MNIIGNKIVKLLNIDILNIEQNLILLNNNGQIISQKKSFKTK